MKIAICDDDEQSRALVRRLSGKLLAKLGVQADFYEFASGEAFCVGCPADVDLVFFDVIMSGMTGVETAQVFRRENTVATIVFMSNYAAYAVEGYGVKAYRYLLKPITPRRFEDELSDAFKEIVLNRKNIFVLRNDQGVFTVDPGSLVFVETAGSKTLQFHRLQGDVLARGQLKKWEASLSNLGFFRCHSSYLVNLSFVDSVLSSGEILLSTGDRVPVSKHRRRALDEALIDFASRRL